MRGINRVDYTGQVFGRLTVLGEAEKVGKHRKLLCACTCGVVKPMYLVVIKAGAESCGCRQLESATTHGQSRSKNPLYYAWSNMKSRCSDPNAKYYSEYGGRGITVCQEWIDSFESFQNWAHTSGYLEGLTLDRSDNSKGYCPSNCQWTNRTEQQRNRRSQKGSSSKYVGVSFCNRSKQWIASVKINGKSINLGSYSEEIDAAIARDSYIITNKLTSFTMNGVI